MNSVINANIGEIDHLNLLLLLGIAVFGGTVGARLFHKLHFPQIIGYIIIGLIIGESGLKLISGSIISTVEPLNYFALGIIGFMIGGELKSDIFKKYGKQFVAILLAEGIAAFILVGVSTFLLTYLFTGNLKLSVALGVVLGAISSATDPASTIQVLWEYKTRGPLTTAAIAVVALDDALALSLYAFGTSLAGILTGYHAASGVAAAIGLAVYKLGIALLVGFVAGLVLRSILVRIHDRDSALTFAVGGVLLVIGLSLTLDLDIILSSMALGLTLVNCAPRRSQETFEVIKKFAPPIYVLFFVLVGARLKIENMSYLTWLLVAAYILCRSVGKISGAYLGATLSNARKTVRKYLGLCLFAQGGVAIGLSIMASQRFDNRISSMVILVVATTTFIVQLIGPIFVKSGVKKAGEIGMNVTEEDLIKTYTVKDVMDAAPTSIAQDLPLQQILEVFSTSDSVYYPVIDSQSRIVGIITIAGIKEMFASQKIAGWLLACDVAEPVLDKTMPNKPLEEAMEHMSRYDLENMPVVASDDNNDELVGVLDYRMVNRKISAEVLHRRKVADGMTLATG
ncbi:MAG TPA: CBS domain-containing protein [Phycisphaerales bacterium]|nr:CBS domain-containing protein [Phycisphaerales bacterium]